jgi:hypothetical protein
MNSVIVDNVHWFLTKGSKFDWQLAGSDNIATTETAGRNGIHLQ